MPGTVDEWPNWSLALPKSLDEIERDPVVLAVAAALDDGRRRSEPYESRRADRRASALARADERVDRRPRRARAASACSSTRRPTRARSWSASRITGSASSRSSTPTATSITSVGSAPWCTTRIVSASRRTSRSASMTPTSTCCSTPSARAGCSAQYLEGLDLRPPETIYGLDDGQRISGAGMTFTPIHTPGHTQGSVCFRLDIEGEAPDPVLRRSSLRRDRSVAPISPVAATSS